MKVRAAHLLAIPALVCFVTAARADDSAASPAARALYAEATKAMDEKDYATACPKLEEVVRQVPEGVGARFTLGECYEGSGRLASAWNAYNEAAALAAKTGQTPRLQKARAAAEALHSRLARLTIEVAPEVLALPGLVVTRDGLPVEPKSFGAALPIDRGPHKVTARAPGRSLVEKSADVATDGGETKVRLTDLPVATGDEPSPPPTVQPVTPPVDTRPTKSSLSPLVFVGFGVGVAGLAVGAITGAITLSKASDCKSARVCTQGTINGTKTTAWISDVGFVVGAAGVAVGVVALVTSPKTQPGPSAQLRVGPGSLIAEGSF